MTEKEHQQLANAIAKEITKTVIPALSKHLKEMLMQLDREGWQTKKLAETMRKL